MGFTVQGSDLNNNKNTDRLIKLGIKIYFGHNPKNLDKATMVVVSSAIKKNNKELIASKNKKLSVVKRGEMLANVVALKKNIVITGSHGKTTTTSLIANILEEAELDPTIINGGIINSLKNNAHLGKGEWAVIESDESDGSFLNLPITYSIVTNLDREHLDYYKSFDRLKNCFRSFIEKTPSFGKSLICLDDNNLKNLIYKCKNNNFITYGFNKKSNYQILNVRKKPNCSIFDLRIKIAGTKIFKIKNIQVNLIGDHNVLNTTASIAIALNLGIKIYTIKKVLKNFSGIQRRFTKVFSVDKKDFSSLSTRAREFFIELTLPASRWASTSAVLSFAGLAPHPSMASRSSSANRSKSPLRSFGLCRANPIRSASWSAVAGEVPARRTPRRARSER